MITTVTTVTTITAIAAVGLTTVISSVAIVALIFFLCSRELASVSQSRLSWRIARYAGVGILPMVLVFAAIVVVKIIGLF